VPGSCSASFCSERVPSCCSSTLPRGCCHRNQGAPCQSQSPIAGALGNVGVGMLRRDGLLLTGVGEGDLQERCLGSCLGVVDPDLAPGVLNLSVSLYFYINSKPVYIFRKKRRRKKRRSPLPGQTSALEWW
jgi:hypothetical protein